MLEKKKNNVLGQIVPFLFIAVIEYVFFLSAWDHNQLIGDGADGKLNTIFAEHWYQFFSGKEKATDVLRMFYPEANVLARSDIMLGFAIPYCFLRLLGINMYAAFKYVLIGTHILGSFSLYIFMEKYLHVLKLIALVTVTGFSAGLSYYYISSNVQFFAASFLPLICIALAKYFESVTSKKRYGYAALAILLFSGLFYTAFYVGYMISIMIMVFLLSWIIVALFYKLLKKETVFFEFVFDHIIELIGYAVLLGISFIPFIRIYLPVLNETGGKEWSFVFYSMPTLDQVFISFREKLGQTIRFENYREYIGFPVLEILVLLIVLIISICWTEQSFRKFTVVVFISSLWNFFLGIRFGNYSLWRMIFLFVPGGTAIRAVQRWYFVFSLPFLVTLGYYLNVCIKRWKFKSVLCGLILMITIVSNMDFNGVDASWTIEGEKELLSYVKAPPKDCEVFYLEDEVSDIGNKVEIDAPFVEDLKGQLDAVTIAMQYHVYTVNGYSGSNPTEWNFITTQDNNDAIYQWVKKHPQLRDQSIYIYSMKNNQWRKINE